ncbi:MAG TPA: phosphomannomutase, partial [Planctomycetaceae bacterium]|nr:phosphomannomutase [Planctomycetaceae bacterium]
MDTVVLYRRNEEKMSGLPMKIDVLMKKSGVPFGTSGVRGLVSDMTDRVCYAYTLGFLAFIKRTLPESPKRVAVAGDLRSSTPRILRAVRRAIEDAGMLPVDCGFIPTPALSLYGFTNAIPSIMVTGSHIPDDRNGMKFNRPDGEILKEDEELIRQQEITIPHDLFGPEGMLKPEFFPSQTVSDDGGAKRMYTDRYLKAFPDKPLAGVRIGLFEHSAVGRDVIFELLTALGAQTTSLGRSEHFLAIDTEAVRAEDIGQAKRWAAGNCAIDGMACDPANPPFDVIFSTDGDSDRPLLFDEVGRLVRGDVLGVLCARFLDADCIVTPVNSNTMLERSAWFGKRHTIRTKIGSPYVV